jgi:NADPH:quinone reductase-like Zn-dependent oxidoreductase
MKAALMDRHGPPDVLRYGDVVDPTPGPGVIVVVPCVVFALLGAACAHFLARSRTASRPP